MSETPTSEQIAQTLVKTAHEWSTKTGSSFDQIHRALVEMTGWVDRAKAAEAKVAAVKKLLRVDDYDPYVHANEGCQGEPDCARCWADDVRAALATEVTA